MHDAFLKYTALKTTAEQWRAVAAGSAKIVWSYDAVDAACWVARQQRASPLGATPDALDSVFFDEVQVRARLKPCVARVN